MLSYVVFFAVWDVETAEARQRPAVTFAAHHWSTGMRIVQTFLKTIVSLPCTIVCYIYYYMAMPSSKYVGYIATIGICMYTKDIV